MKKSLLLLLALVSFFMACETVVEVELPEQVPKLVPYAIVEADCTFIVRLSQSQSILSQQDVQFVPDAEILLYQDENEVDRLEPYGEDPELGIYQTSFRPSSGHTYTLKINKAGFSPVEAQTYLEPAVPIQTLRYDTVQYTYGYQDESGNYSEKTGTRLDEVWLTFKDRPEEDNYYEISVLQYEDRFVSEQQENGEYIITDTIATLLPQQITSEDPAVKDDSFFEDDDDWGDYSLFFTDELFAGKEYTIKFSMFLPSYYTRYNEQSPEYFIVLRNLNRDYYLYRKSYELQNETEDNPFAEPVPVFNNIEGGYGIFAGFSSDTETILLEE
uniref:DUF4249 domain-containing protein n=1 Tax=Roseihalotalea indica TaxID=2867963 RepID=A0AA49GKM7_9BACT|nr:DUF4249 domain-containing protein [Tunicatimonas sp. TK19036]